MVRDREDRCDVRLEIWKDPLTGTVFGVDSETVRECGIKSVSNPFHPWKVRVPQLPRT